MKPRPGSAPLSFAAALLLLAGGVAVACGGSVDDGKAGTPVSPALDGGGSCTPGDKCVTPTCKDGETSNDGCNACSCMNGQMACTDRYCPPAECTEGQTKTDGCNTCACSAGGWACTNRECAPAPTDAGAAPVACGARAGDTCQPTEYCAYEAGSLCGAADGEAVCKPRPTVCDAIGKTVCGCDRHTYGNACEAAMAGTGVDIDRPCPLLP